MRVLDVLSRACVCSCGLCRSATAQGGGEIARRHAFSGWERVVGAVEGPGSRLLHIAEVQARRLSREGGGRWRPPVPAGHRAMLLLFVLQTVCQLSYVCHGPPRGAVPRQLPGGWKLLPTSQPTYLPTYLSHPPAPSPTHPLQEEAAASEEKDEL